MLDSLNQNVRKIFFSNFKVNKIYDFKGLVYSSALLVYDGSASGRISVDGNIFKPNTDYKIETKNINSSNELRFLSHSGKIVKTIPIANDSLQFNTLDYPEFRIYLAGDTDGNIKIFEL